MISDEFTDTVLYLYHILCLFSLSWCGSSRPVYCNHNYSYRLHHQRANHHPNNDSDWYVYYRYMHIVYIYITPIVDFVMTEIHHKKNIYTIHHIMEIALLREPQSVERKISVEDYHHLWCRPAGSVCMQQLWQPPRVTRRWLSWDVSEHGVIFLALVQCWRLIFLEKNHMFV